MAKSLQGMPDTEKVQSYKKELCTRFAVALDMLPSRKYAADISGRSDDMLNLYAKGKSEPPLSVIKAIAEAAGVSLNWITTGEGETQASGVASQNLDQEILTEIFEIIEKSFGYAKPAEKALLSSKIYAYIMKKRAERVNQSRDADSAEIIDLVDILKSVG